MDTWLIAWFIACVGIGVILQLAHVWGRAWTWIKSFAWTWDQGSVCHFLLGFSGGLLGFEFAALFTVTFALIEFEDYRLRLERVREHTDKKPETWERTKQEYFEFLLGLIIASFLRILLLKVT